MESTAFRNSPFQRFGSYCNHSRNYPQCSTKYEVARASVLGIAVNFLGMYSTSGLSGHACEGHGDSQAKTRHVLRSIRQLGLNCCPVHRLHPSDKSAMVLHSDSQQQYLWSVDHADTVVKGDGTIQVYGATVPQNQNLMFGLLCNPLAVITVLRHASSGASRGQVFTGEWPWARPLQQIGMNASGPL